MDTTRRIGIIGGGAAGLAAALETLDRGATPIVFEARPRVGGRAWTLAFAEGAPRAEIGPEFIHGAPAATLDLLARYDLSRYDACGAGFRFGAQGLAPEDDDAENAAERHFFRALDAFAPEEDPTLARVFDRLPPAERDAAYEREIRRTAVGFDAADPERAGARALAIEWRGEAGLTGESSKPLGGYRALMEAAAAEILARGGRIRRRGVVRACRATPGGCAIVADGEHAVDAVVATLPLPLLRASCAAAGATREPGVVDFDGAADATLRAALDRRVMGHVLKPVLRFERAFWETLDGGAYDAAGFFRSAPGSPFPVFWTRYPLREPLLTFWAGGPDAERFAEVARAADRRDDDAYRIADPAHPFVRAALETLDATLRVDARPYFREAICVDWRREPFTGGAYSYAAPHGHADRDIFARPLGARVFLAGETFAPPGHTGTVAGAIASGRDAAARACAAAGF